MDILVRYCLRFCNNDTLKPAGDILIRKLALNYYIRQYMVRRGYANSNCKSVEKVEIGNESPNQKAGREPHEDHS